MEFEAVWADIVSMGEVEDSLLVNNGSRYFLMEWSGNGANTVVELSDELAVMKWDDAWNYLNQMLTLLANGGE